MTLEAVSETLFIPLYGRSRARDWHATFRDPLAEALVPRLDYDFTRIRARRLPQIVSVVRSERIDALTRDFVARNPGGRLINLGAGLCTRFHRVDDGRIEAWEVDFSDVISLRKRLLPADARDHAYAGTALGEDWIRELCGPGRGPTLVIAEGLLHYFAPADVATLFSRLERAGGPLEMIFDFYAPWLIRSPGAKARVSKGSARLRWGARTAAELTVWAPSLRVRSEDSLVPGIAERLPLFRLLGGLPGFRRVYRVAHVTLGGNPPRATEI